MHGLTRSDCINMFTNKKGFQFICTMIMLFANNKDDNYNET